MERAFWGFIFGDAFGVPVEFLERDTFHISDMEGYGSWDVPEGTWSDDSAMTFILMEQLAQGGTVNDLKQAYCDWVFRGHWTYNGEPAFDVGITVREIVSRWERIGFSEVAQSDEWSNGNGALMRILPVAFLTYKKDYSIEDTVIAYARLTHGHIRSSLCCIHYTYVVHNLLDGYSKEESIRLANTRFDLLLEHYETERGHFARLDGIGSLKRDDIRSTGYVVDTLEAVYWSFLKSDSYMSTISTAVHLGKDTDTIGAIAGSLAGLYYDVLNVPAHWYNLVPKRAEIELLIQRFLGLFEE